MSRTKAQLEHENAAQRDMLAAMAAEIEALRDLIAAAAECADVPVAATGHQASDRLAWYRANLIRAALRNIDYSTGYLCAVLAAMAGGLREEAAKPAGYTLYLPPQDAEFAADAASLDDLEPLPAREPDERLSHADGTTRPCRSPQAHGYSALADDGIVECDVPGHHATADGGAK